MVDVQLCVVHLVRNSLRFASKADWQAITRQLKAIYTAPGLEAAKQAFAEFAETWEDKYPAMIKSWLDQWDDFIPFLEFPNELRKIVYSTDVIVNRFGPVFGVANGQRGLRRLFPLAPRVPSQHLVAL